MTIKQAIKKITQESTTIFEVGIKKIHGKTVTLEFYAGKFDTYEKLTKLLKREGYTVLS
tara:strand:+ start:716 stop:892 length:177 start_codon:yes stop_codon:yes gene_type:complete